MNFDELVAQKSKAHGIDQALLYAFIMVESGGNPWAMRYEPTMRWLIAPEMSKKFAAQCGVTFETEIMCQKSSWGLMQVMGSVARELGYAKPLSSLCDPQFGLEIGCQHLKKFLKKYPKLEDAIASYNAGIPKFNSLGKYLNQEYVDKIMMYYNNYKKVGLQ